MIAFFVLLPLHFAFTKRWPGASLVLLALLFFGLSVRDMVTTRATVNAERQVARDVARKAREIQGGLSTAQPSRRGIPHNYAVFSDFMTSEMERWRKIGESSSARTAALRLDTVIAPQAFASRAGMKDAQMRLRRLSALLDGEERSMIEAYDGFEQRLIRLPISESLKQACLDRFRDGRRAGIAWMRKYLDIQRRFVQACEELHGLMNESYGHYTISGAVILFESEASMKRYNALCGEIADIAKEGEACRATQNARTNEWISSLERMAR